MNHDILRKMHEGNWQAAEASHVGCGLETLKG